jgi:hypothetical protein
MWQWQWLGGSVVGVAVWRNHMRNVLGLQGVGGSGWVAVAVAGWQCGSGSGSGSG